MYQPEESTGATIPASEAQAPRGGDVPRKVALWLLFVIVGIALVLRLWGVNWDEGHHLHPDERFLSFVVNDVSVPSSIDDFFDTSTSSFSPYNRNHNQFVYGTLPLFTTKISGEIADELENKPIFSTISETLFNNHDGQDLSLAGYQGNLIGRVLSALFDVGSVIMIFLIGSLLFNRKVALLGAFLLAINVFHIQLSHFFAVDTFLTFFTLGVIYFSIRISRGGGWWVYGFAGVSYALALASKISALTLIGVIVLAILIRLWPLLRDQAIVWWPSLRTTLKPGDPAVPPTSTPPALATPPVSAPAPATAPTPTVEPGSLTEAPAPGGSAISLQLLPSLAAAIVFLTMLFAFSTLLRFSLINYVSALLVAALTFVAVLSRLARPARQPEDSTLPGQAAFAVIGLALVIFSALVVFRVAMPYAFEGPNIWNLEINEQFKDDMRQSLALQEGGDFPPNMQWVGRTAYLFPWTNMVVWGMGPALGIAVWLGFLYAGWRMIAKRDARPILLVAWVGVTFAYWGGRFNPIMRSFLPIYPSLILLGAFLLVDMWEAGPDVARGLFRRLPNSERWRSYVPMVLKGTAAAVVAITFVYALAFTSIYRNPVSRVEAGAWLTENAPEGSVIASEHWDDGLPLGAGFNYVEMSPYDTDNQAKIDKLISDLDQADYVTYTSNRVYGSVPQIPIKYPETIRYYDLMFAEELGFRLVREFTSYPSLFGISVPDQAAEESFTVYDHPKVLIYEKTDEFSRELLESKLSGARADLAYHVPPKDAATNALQFRPDDLETQRAGGTWSSIFDPDGITNRIPLWTWLFVVELVAFAALPLSLLLFRSLPDRGYLLSKPLGFLGLGYLVWLGVSLKLFDFTRASIIFVLLLMLIAGGVVAYLSRNSLRDFVRDRWRSILFWETLFLGAFVAFYIIRLSNPDLWHPIRGGEKPMDFAYFNAVIRSTTLPPIDPWFSGGYINYYYFGQFLTAVLAKVTGIVPNVSYNLAVPLFFALAVAASYSLVFNLAEATRRFVRRRVRGGRIGPNGPVLAGLGGVLLVLIAGNLGGAKQLIDNFSAISPYHLNVPVLGGFVGVVGGVQARIFESTGLGLGTDWYWAPSRMMPPFISITEFPFFTFLFADLHAHMMAIPFAITSLAVGAAVVLNATRLMKESPQFRTWAGWGLIVVLGLLIGALRWINSWDYPTFLIMGIAVVFIAERVAEGRFNLKMLGWATLKSGVLVVLTLIFFYPFGANYELPATGFQRMDAPGGGRQVTPFHQYLAHFGVFLFLAGAFVAFVASRGVHRLGWPRFMGRLSIVFVGVVLAATVLVGIVGWVFERAPIDFTVVGLSAPDFLRDVVAGILAPLPGDSPIDASIDNEGVRHPTPVVAFTLGGLALLGMLAWLTLRRMRSDGPIQLFVMGMLALALILTAGVDVAILNPDIARMNTVFKFYLHAWVLLAVPAAFGTWYLLDVVRPRFHFSLTMPARAIATPEPSPPPVYGMPVPVTGAKPELPVVAAPRRWRVSGLFISAFAICAAGFIIAALVYPLVATPQRIRDRFDNATAVRPRTDDGLAYMLGGEYTDEKGVIRLADDYAAIKWAQENIEGSPTIIEGLTPNYRWGSRFSINTGLPAVAGWEFHQLQQRGAFGELVVQRQADVLNFYSTTEPEEAQRILEKYSVRYVIVGALERNYYPEPGIAKLEAGLGGMLRRVYSAGETNIYEVVTETALVSGGE